MMKSINRCRVNIADLRTGIPKTREQEVYLNACPIVVPIAYPFGIAFDQSREEGIIDITVINIELEKESLACQLHVNNTCNAILFVVLAHTKLDDELVDTICVHLCEIEPCKGLANVTLGAHIPQTC